MQVRLHIQIRTDNGTFERFGPICLFPSVTRLRQDAQLNYPDSRVEQISVYVTDDGELWYLHSSHNTRPSEVNNLAYAIIEEDAPYFNVETQEIDFTVNQDGNAFDQGTSIAPDEIEVVNMRIDWEPGRILVSESSKPREMQARRVIRINQAENDPILAFATNTRSLGEGQFGQHPVMVFSRHNITPLQVGPDDIAFIKGEPIAVRQGAIGRYAVTNVDQAIIFASEDGVYQLGRDLISLSRIVHSPMYGHPEHMDCEEDWTVDSLPQKLSVDTCLSYYKERLYQIEEIWVSTRDFATYAFTLEQGRWFTMKDRKRQFLLPVFHRDSLMPFQALYGVGQDGFLYEEANRIRQDGVLQPDAPFLPTEFIWQPSVVHLGYPGLRKRIRRFSIRQQNMVESLTWSLIAPITACPNERCQYDKELNVGCSHAFHMYGGILIRQGQLGRCVSCDTLTMTGVRMWDFILHVKGQGYPHQIILGAEFVFFLQNTQREKIENYWKAQ